MRVRLVLILFVVALGGCSSQPPGVPLEGVVYLEGKPLPLAAVTLVPITEGLAAANGITDKDGVVRPTSAGSGTGVVEGKYKVIVIVPPVPNAPTIPKIYADAARTPLTVEVPSPTRFEVHLSKTAP